MSAPENRAALVAEIMTNLASGQPGGITALQLQAVLEDVVNSVYNLVDSNASVSVTYTGTPLTPIAFLITPQSVYVPVASGTGSPQVFQQSTEANFQVGLDYEECTANTSNPPGTGLTSLSLNNVISGSLIVISGCPYIISLSFPALLDSGLIHISGLRSLTALSFPNFTQTTQTPYPSIFGSGDFLVAGCSSLTTISLPSLTMIGAGNSVGQGGFAPSQNAILTTLSIPILSVVNGLFAPQLMPLLATLSAPSLTTVTAIFEPLTLNALTTFNFPLLATVGNNFTPSGLPLLTSMPLPSLAYVGGLFNPSAMASLVSLSCPALQKVGSSVSASNMASLTTASFPAMVSYGSTISLNSGLGALANVTLGTNGVLQSIAGPTINISGQALTSASVNAILSLLVSLNGSGGTTLWGSGQTLTINGGTNAAPSGQGITDKATLIARGATVTTN